jgi:hypothetical protein
MKIMKHQKSITSMTTKSVNLNREIVNLGNKIKISTNLISQNKTVIQKF